jgi:RNA recognition motif-containing protein
MRIYVGNLPYSVTDEDLREVFGEYGELSSAEVIKDKFSGQSKGFGFVEMPNGSEADAAIKELNESPFKGRKLTVNEARPRSEQQRPRGGGGGGGGGGWGGGGGRDRDRDSGRY